MKLLVFADQKVGFEITRFLISEFKQDLVLVVTLEENAVFHAAQAADIRTHIFSTSDELICRLNDTQVDLGLLAWWPKIIPSQLLGAPRLGFINTHPSLLPYNRGKHYNFWAIVEEAPFGVSLHHIDNGIDTGDIVSQVPINYDWCDTGGSLYHKAQEAMISLFKKAYPTLRDGTFPRYPQDLSKGSTHRAKELEPASRIDLDTSYVARDILNRLRARTFPGYPSCWFEADGYRYEVRVDIRRCKA